MKRIIFVLVAFVLMAGAVSAQDKTYYAEVYPAGARGTAMGFSGTSVCPVIDLSAYDMDGYLSFQMKSLSSATGYLPSSGTTISAAWRVSNIDSPAAWVVATINPIFTGINAFSGATAVAYPIQATLANGLTGVSPYRYIRLEFTSGVQVGTGSNIIPIGVLFGR